jgi:hypothetical protein
MTDATALYRAVGPAELESINALGKFTNLPGLEVKYFAATLEGASAYARAAAAAFGDGPFKIVKTSIASRLIDENMTCTVDSGIMTIVVPQGLLGALAAPELVSSSESANEGDED